VYAAADVFVTLSDRTNVLNPLNEAMMSGLPVVALNTGRTGTVVRDGENGVLLEPAGLAGLADVILGLLTDGPKRKALGAAARASADRRLPSIEERQAAEVGAVLRVVSEGRSGRGR
jgi:glycosyltransferase involved in cell wall biosynthesis